MSEWWFVSSSSSCCQQLRDPCCPEDKPPEQPRRIVLPWSFLSYCILIILILIFALAFICLGVPNSGSKTSLPADPKGTDTPKEKGGPKEIDPKGPDIPKGKEDPKGTEDPKAPDPGGEKVPDDAMELPEDLKLPEKRKEPEVDGISLDVISSSEETASDDVEETRDSDDYIYVLRGAGDSNNGRYSRKKSDQSLKF